jgi:hypothetical protein
LLVLAVESVFSQKILRITKSRLGITRQYEVFNYELLEYKLKGEFKFRKNRIINMLDSTIVLDDYTEIKLVQLKALRLRKNNHLIGTLQAFFIGGGIGFITLNTVNNLIITTRPVLSENAALISAALVTVGLLISELNVKRIRVTRNSYLKIINIDYQNLK